MTYAQLSPKYQVVIPKEVRNRLPLKPGQKMIVMEKGGVIHLIPVLPLQKLKGIFKGSSFDLKDLRDKKDRL